MTPAQYEEKCPRFMMKYTRALYSKEYNLLSPMHAHSSCDEIIYILEGSMQILLPGGKTFNLAPGNSIYFSASFPHETRAELNTKMRLLQFDTNFFVNLSNNSYEKNEFSLVKRDYALFPESTESGKKLNSYIDMLDKFYDTGITEYTYGCFFLITGLLISDKIISFPQVKNTASFRKISPVIEFLREHFNEKLSLDDIADRAGYHKDYLSRLFREASGMTIIEYINNLRIEEARFLLLSTDKSVTEICYETGFGSTSYFSKQFLKKYDLTPARYRYCSKLDNPYVLGENAIDSFRFENKSGKEDI